MSVERIDRYTLLVDGHRITANESQERAIAAMDDEQRSRFLTVMGVSRE